MTESPKVAVVVDIRWPMKRHQSVYAGIQVVAEKQKWDTWLFPRPEYVNLHLKERSLDGMIVRIGPEPARQIQKYNIPAVDPSPSGHRRTVRRGQVSYQSMIDRRLRLPACGATGNLVRCDWRQHDALLSRDLDTSDGVHVARGPRARWGAKGAAAQGAGRHRGGPRESAQTSGPGNTSSASCRAARRREGPWAGGP